MSPFVTLTLAAVGTYALRLAMVVGEGRLTGSAWVQRQVPVVSPAALAAIVTSGVLLSDGAIVKPDLAALVALGAAAMVVRRTGNVATALVAGLPVYWLSTMAGIT